MPPATLATVSGKIWRRSCEPGMRSSALGACLRSGVEQPVEDCRRGGTGSVNSVEAFRVGRDLEPFRRDVDGAVGDSLPAAPPRIALQAVANARVEVVADDPAPVRSSEGDEVGALVLTLSTTDCR